MAISVVANPNDTRVLIVMASPKRYQVRNANTIIPEPNPINLPGHNNPS